MSKPQWAAGSAALPWYGCRDGSQPTPQRINLSLPLVDSGTELVRIDQIDDVLIFFNHQSVTRQ